MASPFWTYFHDKLRWALINSPGPLSAVLQGLASRLDEVRNDIVFLRDQGFTQRCEPENVPVHGSSRGITRYVAETPEQFRNRVINAYSWHLLGGKQEGLPKILQFYGYDVAEVESIATYLSSRWAEFQVNLPIFHSAEEQANMLETLEMLIWLINEYKPARSVLARLYNDGCNITPLIWSKGKYSEHFYSHFSGVPASTVNNEFDEELLLSFGFQTTIGFEKDKVNTPPVLFMQAEEGFIASYINAPIWSAFNYSDAFIPPPRFTLGEALSLEWNRTDTAWGIYPICSSKSQLFYSDQRPDGNRGKWSDLNANYGIPKTVQISTSFIWGNFLYSDNPDRQEIFVHEQFAKTLTVASENITFTNFAVEVSGNIGISTPVRHSSTWSGKWDKRRWYNYHCYYSITSSTEESDNESCNIY